MADCNRCAVLYVWLGSLRISPRRQKGLNMLEFLCVAGYILAFGAGLFVVCAIIITAGNIAGERG